MLFVAQHRLEKVSVSGASADRYALPGQLNRLLAVADWLPSGLPAEAIVVIRRFRVPLPTAVLQPLGHPRVQRDWSQHTAGRLTEVIAQAARPALGPVGASAEAVLFADQAELLACLASDWQRGQLGSCWWWRSLLGALDGRAAVHQTWLAAPEYVPAALAQLTLKGEAVAFARALGAEQARALRQAVTARFGLPKIERSLREWEVVQSAAPDLRLAAKLWLPQVPECTSVVLECAAQTLLGVGLLLARAPAVIRSHAFAQRLQAELDASRVTMAPRLPQAEEQAPTRLTYSPHPPIAAAAQQHEEPPTQGASLPEPLTSRVERWEGGGAARPSNRNATLANDVTEMPVAVLAAEMPFIERPLEGAVGTAERLPLLLRARERGTDFGGVFYLVNLALWLGWYGDFTMPQEPGLDLPIWDFLALAGRELAGEELTADPVWELLAQLAGRAAESEPGADFTPPPEWLALNDWRAWLRDTLHTRLQAALGAMDERALGTLVCRARAQVRVTATHLDVTFSLAELPLEIRLAGLDRDPGWVPAAGRYLAFHFD